MRVPLHVVEARREKLAALIDRHRYLQNLVNVANR